MIGTGNSVIAGEGGNDLIISRDGDDLMFGGEGDDILIGGWRCESHDWRYWKRPICPGQKKGVAVIGDFTRGEDSLIFGGYGNE